MEIKNAIYIDIHLSIENLTFNLKFFRFLINLNHLYKKYTIL
jgi:hypothetical protein